MAYHRIQTCTQEGMVPSQPGMGVSVCSGGGVVELHVYRMYDHLVNEFGGRGVFLRGDAYGRRFPTEQAAWDFALERGYIQPWFYPEARARRIAQAQARKAYAKHATPADVQALIDNLPEAA